MTFRSPERFPTSKWWATRFSFASKSVVSSVTLVVKWLSLRLRLSEKTIRFPILSISKSLRSLFNETAENFLIKRFYRPTFRMHLTNQEIVLRLLSYSDELKKHYELYQILLFHFQEKNSQAFFDLIQENKKTVDPLISTRFQDLHKG